jgi:hypothetical protein
MMCISMKCEWSTALQTCVCLVTLGKVIPDHFTREGEHEGTLEFCKSAAHTYFSIASFEKRQRSVG